MLKPACEMSCLKGCKAMHYKLCRTSSPMRGTAKADDMQSGLSASVSETRTLEFVQLNANRFLTHLLMECLMPV